MVDLFIYLPCLYLFLQQLPQYTFLADYKVYNTSNEQMISLASPFGEQKLQHAEWGPIGNQLVSCVYTFVKTSATYMSSTTYHYVIDNSLPK